jgi:hypothetical protein
MSQTSAQHDRTDFDLADVSVTLPKAAIGTAVKKAAKRFETAYGLPSGAAFALAAASVDPAVERGKIPSQNPQDHLALIRTPSSRLLACHSARLWSPLVSGDGSNGRSRYELQTEGDDSIRPWPVAKHADPAIVDYHTPAIEDMVAAAEASAESIRSPRLVTEISRHDRGVWHPPVVVIGCAIAPDGDGDEKRWFLHTIEGSTRIEACHELTEVEAGAPLHHSDEPLTHLRETRDRLVERFETLPTSPGSLAAARAATIPALVVVAVVDEAGGVVSDGFPDVVNSYVESVHVQPRPFSDVAMNNVLGERLLLTLRREGLLEPETMENLIGRGPTAAGKPSVRAAELVHLICDAKNETFVRDVAITKPRGHLTKDRRANLIGPLVVRQFKKPAETADRALMRRFTPEALIEKTWSVSGVSSAVLRKRAVAKFEEGEPSAPIVLELISRGGPALCAAGLLLSDQGSTVEGKPQLRGSVDRVLEGLVTSRGGIEVLADAVAWADGDRALLPRRRRLDGTVKIDAQGDELHYVAQWSKGNMEIRALALNKGVIPRKERSPGSGGSKTSLTPEEAFKQTEEEMRTSISSADTKLHDLLAMTDEQGRRLIERIGLQPAPAVRKFADKVSVAYARYGDDPLADLDEDQMPDAEVTLEDEAGEG